MREGKLTKKYGIVFLLVCFIGFYSWPLTAGENYSLKNYTSKFRDTYTYVTDELAAKYDTSFEKFICNDGEDWAMESSVYQITEADSGGLQVYGSSTLVNKSIISGFTGGSFVNIKNLNNEDIYLGSTKSGLPLGIVDVDEDLASQVGWGLNPGKAEVYVSEYKKKKIAWWTVKIPILRVRIIPNTRTVSWHFEIPAYVANKEINIEIINSHTPTGRVLQAVERAGNITYSFALQCGLPTAFLTIKIVRGSFAFSDFESYICCVIRWASNEEFLDSSKSKNVQNILHAIGDLVDTYKDGLDFQQQMDLATMGFDLVTMISNKSFNIQSLSSFISSLEALTLNSDGNVISGTLEQVEVILENLKPLLKLSDKQSEIYDTVFSTVAFINGIGDEANSKIYTALNGFDLIFDIYEQVKYGNITIDNAEVLINKWLDKVGVIIENTAPEYYDEFRAYRYTAGKLLVGIITLAETQNWI